MGQLKKLVPRQTRRKVVEALDEAMPHGFIRNNSANAITLVGGALVALGVRGNGWLALGTRAAGHAADDIDGDWSRAFRISSELGAILDAATDKFKVALEVAHRWRAASMLEGKHRSLRQAALSAIIAKHSVNATLNTFATARGIKAETSNSGRANMWADGVALAGFGLADVARDKDHRALELAGNVVGYTATVVGLPLGAITAFGYAQVALGPTSEISIEPLASSP